jgi:hypothetical protein
MSRMSTYGAQTSREAPSVRGDGLTARFIHCGAIRASAPPICIPTDGQAVTVSSVGVDMQLPIHVVFSQVRHAFFLSQEPEFFLDRVYRHAPSPTLTGCAVGLVVGSRVCNRPHGHACGVLRLMHMDEEKYRACKCCLLRVEWEAARDWGNMCGIDEGNFPMGAAPGALGTWEPVVVVVEYMNSQAKILLFIVR